MGKLHEVLAVERTLVAASNTLLNETADKLSKPQYFLGEDRSLKMLEDTPTNRAEEQAARVSKAMATTVPETLKFMFEVWSKAEDALYQKNVANTTAFADIIYRGKVIAGHVPVDELMGLESRLQVIKDKIFAVMPTLDASKHWKEDPQAGKGVYVAPEVQMTKTQKIMYPVVMALATDKHPAQVKEATKDEVVGLFSSIQRSGAVTAYQKSEALLAVEDLIAAVKQARMRANMVDVQNDTIAKAIVTVLLAPFELSGL